MLNKKIYAIGIFLVLGIFMITSPSFNLRIYAADENQEGGGKESNGGKDKQESSSSNEESNSNNSPQEDKQETNDEPKDEPKQQQEDPVEKAAQEDYQADKLRDDQLPNVKDTQVWKDNNPEPPVDKPIIKPVPNTGEDKMICYHNYGCSTSPPPKGWECKQHPDMCDKPIHKFPDKDKDKGEGGGGYGHDGDNNNGNHDHHNHNHKHNHNNDKHHYDSNTKNYYYYYTNDYSNNHATVILQPDYSHTNNYDDIRVVIGDEQAFDTIINFAGKPENLVVTGLDINEGEQFDVCMKNESNDKINCVTATLKDENKAVYVDIRVP